MTEQGPDFRPERYLQPKVAMLGAATALFDGFAADYLAGYAQKFGEVLPYTSRDVLLLSFGGNKPEVDTRAYSGLPSLGIDRAKVSQIVFHTTRHSEYLTGRADAHFLGINVFLYKNGEPTIAPGDEVVACQFSENAENDYVILLGHESPPMLLHYGFLDDADGWPTVETINAARKHLLSDEDCVGALGAIAALKGTVNIDKDYSLAVAETAK